MNSKQAAKALRELKAERSKLAGRIAELEAEQQEAPVSSLARITSELVALDRTLSIVDERLPRARAALQDAQQAERATAILALRPKEKKRFDAVVVQALRLRDVLRDLDQVRADLASFGGGPEGSTGIVSDGLRGQISTWHYQQNMVGEYGGRVRLDWPDRY